MPAKKSTAKSSAKKKPAARKAPVKRTVAASHHRPFMQAKLTEQTIYWLVIGIAVLILGGWVLSLQAQLNDLYDTIDATSAASTFVSLNR